MPETPAKLGKYHLLEPIAQGGMAEVYRAKTVGIAGFEKVLAIKRIRPRFAREPRFIRNFVDEARIAVSLNHRNIIQVFDFGKAEGELFLAMELIEGVDLRSALRDATAGGLMMPIGLACYVLADVGAGLDYAHRKRDAAGRSLGIVHCDVSPHNVMLSREGFVKILDFGVARARFTAAPKGRRLRGKPRYMSPEQTHGEIATAASDVFALGILSWELLTGLPLFSGADLKEVLAAVRRCDAPPVASLCPDVPAALSAAVARALERDPARRGTAAELAGELARAARGLATVAASRALAEWLDELYPDGADEDTQPPTRPEVPPQRTVVDRAPSPSGAALLTTDEVSEIEDSLPELADATQERSVDVPEAASDGLDALLEKRRVVVTAVLVDGGNDGDRRELLRILADLAYKRGAVIQDRTDDATIAVFGLEVAGEDDVASAMRYALDAVELAREAGSEAEKPRAPLAVRVATRAGVVAQRKRGAYRLRAGAIGDARALARDAEADRPLLTGGAGRIASAQFSFRELPARRLGSRRLRVLELLGPRDYDERVRALRARSGRFVGRDRELGALIELHAKSSSTPGRTVAAVVGGAGIGKSRLIAELVARLREGSLRPQLIAVSAVHGSRDAPYSLVVDLIAAALNVPPDRGEAARARLMQHLSARVREAGVADGEIEEGVGAIELAMELRDGALSGTSQPTADLRDRVAGSLRRFREATAAGRSCVTVLENLHLADHASLDVLRALLAGPPSTARELVVVSSRGDLGELLADMPRETFELGELEAGPRHELICERLGVEPGDDASAERVNAVARRAGGNPLFIEELAGVVRELGTDATPATVRDVIVARVDRLPRGAKAVLQHAAVIGPVFRARILEELAGRSVHGFLQTLAEEGLVDRCDHGSVDVEEGELRFRHGLIGEVVYESLAAGPRRAAHAKLGRLLALRAEAGRDEPPAVIARHLELGGDLHGAATFSIRAGKVALAAHEPATARDAFSRALELAGGDRDLRLAALLGRERAHRDLGDHDAQARDLAALEHLAAADPTLEAEVATRVAHRLLRTGDLRAAMRSAEKAVAAARAAGDEMCRGEALRVLGEAHERSGAFDRGLEVVSQAIAVFQGLGESKAEMRARIDIGRNYLVRSRYADARAIYEPILARLDEAGDPWLERIAHNHVAVIKLCMGELSDAMRSAQRSVEICEYYADRARAGDNLSVCGIILTEVGQLDEARRHFERALAIHDETGSRWSRCDCLVYAGGLRALQGDHEAGLAMIGEARRGARELGAPYIEANASNALAAAYLLRGGRGDLERALDAAGAAADVAEQATLSGALILALTRQAEAMRRRGATSAVEVSARAVALLGEQHHIEGPEEEVLFTHYCNLVDAGDPDAADLLDRAHESFERKLANLEDPAWRRSFRQVVPVNVALLRHVERSRAKVSEA